MKDLKTALIANVFAWVPYLLVAWGYVALIDGRATDFFTALGVLLTLRLFFVVIETLGGILAWRVYGRRTAVKKLVHFLKENNFPVRKEQAHDDFLAYLVRIQDDLTYPEKMQTLARESEREIARMEGAGALWAMRIDDAVQRAFNQYTAETNR